MKTKTLVLIGAVVSIVFIFSQLKPQDYPFYKENKNYVVDSNYLIKDVKKLSPDDVKTLMKFQTTYGRTLGKNYLVNVINRQNILRGCLMKANIDWTKYGNLKDRVQEILAKYGAKELNTNYYSIQNNQVVTNAVLFKDKDLVSLNKLSIKGANEVTICGDYMKSVRISRLLRVTRMDTKFDPRVSVKMSDILAQYK